MKRILSLLLIVLSLSLATVAGAQEPHRNDRLQIILETVSSATGLEQTEIIRQMTEDGKTLETIITENGGDLAAVQAQLVETLTSDMEQQVTDILSNPLPRNPQRPNDRFQDRLDNPLVREVIRHISEAGIEPQDLREKIEAGATLSEIAAEAGLSTEEIVANIQTEAGERLAADVAAGELTQAEADERLANLDELLNNALNTPLPELERQARFTGAVAGAAHRATTETLGLERGDMRELLQEGETLASFIEAQGGDVTAVTATAQTLVEEEMTKLVEDGRLTQEQADVLMATLDETLETVFNREFRLPKNDRPRN